MTTQVVYDGPFDEVEIVEAGNVVAERGKPVDIEDDEVAARMLEQDIWKEAPKREQPASRVTSPKSEKGGE